MHKPTVLLLSLALASPALADEGMWTFDNFPSAAVKQKYGVDISRAWLRARATFSDTSRKRLHRFLHLPRWPGPDESSLRDGMSVRTVEPATGLRRSGLQRPRAQRRAQMPDRNPVGADRDQENITDKINAVTRGLPDAKANAVAQAGTEPTRSRLHRGVAQRSSHRSARLRIGHAVPGRPVLSVQVQALRRRAHGVRSA